MFAIPSDLMAKPFDDQLLHKIIFNSIHFDVKYRLVFDGYNTRE